MAINLNRVISNQNYQASAKRQLGMTFSAARYKLMQDIMFAALQMSGQAICSVCHQPITTAADFTIVHITSWSTAANPLHAYFDLMNINFGHRICVNHNAQRAKLWGSVKYKGVSEVKKLNMFRAQATVNKQGYFFGTYSTAKEAAEVYDREIVKIKPTAVTNKSLGLI
jgi:hypothetical protein